MRGTSAGMHAVVLSEIHLPYDRALRGRAGLCPARCHCFLAWLWSCPQCPAPGCALGTLGTGRSWGGLGISRCAQWCLWSGQLNLWKQIILGQELADVTVLRAVSTWFSRKTILTTKCCLLPQKSVTASIPNTLKRNKNSAQSFPWSIILHPSA